MATHAELECKVFSGSRVPSPSIDLTKMDPHPFYQCITPLRCLLLKETHPNKWAALQVVVVVVRTYVRAYIVKARLDHVITYPEHDKRDEVHWKQVQHNVVRYLRVTCGLAERFSENEINHVLGVLEVNAFEITSDDGDRGRGLFPLTSLMSHSCISNTRYVLYYII
jgi:hypothetical protein